MVALLEQLGCTLSYFSAGDTLQRNDNNGSGAKLEEETTEDDPLSNDCKYPSSNSFFRKE
jgi:hypothetical protein